MKDTKEFKILIIEDGELNRKVLTDALQDIYVLDAISSGKDAIKKIREFRPHLILLDIILPDINGFDVLKQVKETHDLKDIPVIIITGLDNDQDEEKGLSMGAVDYIRKPFNSFLVKARVNTHIQITKQMLMIEKLSFYDALTCLPNRRKFDYHVEYEWHRAIRKKSFIGFLMMDLDNFKNYNDHYGHAQGDEMLRGVAEVLRNTLNRSTDIPCRWGGEEFAVLIPETNPEELLLIAEKIRAEIEVLKVPSIRTNEATRITISIGAGCMVPRQNELLGEFIQNVDRLLYKAKNGGKNQVQSAMLQRQRILEDT